VEEVKRRVEEFMAKHNENSRSLPLELVLFKGAPPPPRRSASFLLASVLRDWGHAGVGWRA
jgi:hypothetical protein